MINQSAKQSTNHCGEARARGKQRALLAGFKQAFTNLHGNKHTRTPMQRKTKPNTERNGHIAITRDCLIGYSRGATIAHEAGTGACCLLEPV